MPVLCLSFVIAVLDQLTKQLVLTRLDRDHGLPLIPGFFDLRYVQNTGAAWGIMQGLNGWLVVLSFLMLGLLVFFRRHFIAESALARVASGLIIGGIVGNLVDRVRLSYVVDFLFFYWRHPQHSFPAFNVADSAICVGVGLYLIAQWRDQRRAAAAGHETQPNPSGPAAPPEEGIAAR
ncbi:MAG: signal peptidase II [Lentisphaerae bacterium]|nr:signal peptidase II [Lentisphaerota bacterium]